MTLSDSIIETVLIEGHTDSKMFHNETGFNSNWGLSAMRSISIFDHLIADKPGLKNIQNSDGFSILGVSAYAASRPIPNATLQQNRRIDIRFIMRSPSPQEIERIKTEIKAE
jgi:chemotaxis protein MotB